MKLYLRQTFTRPVHGVMLTGPYKSFDWSIDRHGIDGYTRVGSWGANYFFGVKTGKSDRATLGNARRALANRAKHAGETCTFEYVEE